MKSVPNSKIIDFFTAGFEQMMIKRTMPGKDKRNTEFYYQDDFLKGGKMYAVRNLTIGQLENALNCAVYFG